MDSHGILLMSHLTISYHVPQNYWYSSQFQVPSVKHAARWGTVSCRKFDVLQSLLLIATAFGITNWYPPGWVFLGNVAVCDFKAQGIRFSGEPSSKSRATVPRHMAQSTVNVVSSRQEPLHVDPSVQLLSNFLKFRLANLERGQAVPHELVGQMTKLVNQEPSR